MKRLIKASAINKYQDVYDNFLPDYGQGENRAEQTVAAVSAIVYGWDNNGNVFDNDWGNGYFDADSLDDSLCSYANWLCRFSTENIRKVLYMVHSVKSEGEYNSLINRLQEVAYNLDTLEYLSQYRTRGDIYECDGPFKVSIMEDYDDETIW